VWLPEHQQVFEHLKSDIVSAPVLCYFDHQRAVIIQTDSSSSGHGPCLLQEGKPAAFASRALSTAETHYAQIEKELLRQFALAKSFTITSTGDRLQFKATINHWRQYFRNHLH